MSAVTDVQKALNAIRRISADTDMKTQSQILELILQTSISQLKSLSVASTPVIQRKRQQPQPLPIPKANKSKAPQQSGNKDYRDNVSDVDALKTIKPQAPIS